MPIVESLRRLRWVSTAAVVALAGTAPACGGDDLGSASEDVTDVNNTTVKKQSIGNCWVYATVGWAESLRLTHAGEQLDLSESYVTYWHWFEQIRGGTNGSSAIASLEAGQIGTGGSPPGRSCRSATPGGRAGHRGRRLRRSWGPSAQGRATAPASTAMPRTPAWKLRIARRALLASQLLAAALVSMGCADVDPAPASETAGVGGGGGAGGGVAGGGGAEAHGDLLACGLTPTCGPIYNHLGPEPIAALECAAELIVSGETGIIEAYYTVSAPTNTWTLVGVLGDGTALVQERVYDCNGGFCGEGTPARPIAAHRICDIVIPQELAADCEQGAPECQWEPWGNVTSSLDNLTNCQPVEDWTCEDLSALIAPQL